VFDLNKYAITSSHEFSYLGFTIHEIVAIDDAHLLLGTNEGLKKAKKDQILKHFYEGRNVSNICLIADSFYLLGLNNFSKHDLKEQLCVWDEHTGEELYHIIQDPIWSIKRVMTTNTYIIKSFK
jgi:hypothetical protein